MPDIISVITNAAVNTACPDYSCLQSVQAIIPEIVEAGYSTDGAMTLSLRFFDVSTPQALQLDQKMIDSICALFPGARFKIKIEVHLRKIHQMEQDDVVLTAVLRGGASLAQELVNSVARHSSLEDLTTLKKMQKIIWYLAADGVAHTGLLWT